MAGTENGREIAWLLGLTVNPGQLDAVRVLMDEKVASTGGESGMQRPAHTS